MTPKHDTCPPTEELLAGYLDASGSPTNDELADHVAGCRRCWQVVEQSLRAEERQLLREMPVLSFSSEPVPRPAEPTPSPVLPGYEVLEVLGYGGAGVVYKARQLSIDRLVAVKVMLGGAHASEETRRRFQREARSLARLGHPNIVRIHDAGTHDGLPFLVMELVEGTTLARLLDGKPLPAREAAELARVLAGALAAAHARNVVHCDLKPANVLLASSVRARSVSDGCSEEPVANAPGSDVTPKISDFGLAKRLDEGALTQSSHPGGTPSYMAPEQVGGGRRAVGVRTDVYGLGAVLYECLTGRPPFRGECHAETLQQVLADDPLPPRRMVPGVPRDLETICLKCLEKEPGHRYADAQALADDLCRFLDGKPVVARPNRAAERAWRFCRRYPAVVTLTTLLILALSGGLCASLHQWRQAAVNAEQAELNWRDAEEARAEAVENGRDLRRVLDELVRLGEDQRPGATARWNYHRLELLRRTANSYLALLRRHDEVPLLEETARLFFLIAHSDEQCRRFEAAKAGYQQAGSLWERLLQREPGNIAGQIEQARCLSRLGAVAHAVGEPGAEDSLRLAVKSWESLKDKLSSAVDKIDVAENHRVLVQSLVGRGAIAEARQDLERLREWLERCCRADPASDLLHVALLRANELEGRFYFSRGDEGEAVRCWKHAYEMRGRLRQPPDFHVSGWDHVGAACLHLAGRPDREPYYTLGVKLGEQELQEAERQAGHAPENLGIAHSVADVSLRLAGAHLRAGHKERAREVLDRFQRTLARFSGRLPPGDDLFLVIANWVLDLGDIQKQVGDDPAALGSARLAREALARWTQPSVRKGDLARLASSRVRVSVLLRNAGDPKGALAVLEETVPTLEVAVREDPDHEGCVLGLAQVWAFAGKCHVRLGCPDRAVEAWLRTVEVLRSGLTRRPTHAPFRERLARQYFSLGRHFLERGRNDDARRWLDEVANLRPEDPETLRLTEAALGKLGVPAPRPAR